MPLSVGILKVLFLPSWYPNVERPIDGIFIQDQARVVARHHEVAVLIPRVSSILGLVNPRWKGRDTITDEAGISTFRFHAQSLVPRSRRFSYHTQLRATFRGLAHVISSWGPPDLIHAHVTLPCGWLARRVATRFNIPYVLTEHRSPFEDNLTSGWSRRLTREALEHARAVIALSPSLAASITRTFPAIIPAVIGEIVHNPPTSPNSMTRTASPGPVRIAAVGGLRPQKGFRNLVEAVALLVDDGLDLHLGIAGDGPLRAELEALVSARGLEHRCRFLGLVPRSQVFDLYHRSDLAVVSSLHETFCLAAAEALAHGLPVVTTRCGGPEHFIGEDNGIAVDADDVEALAEGIRLVVKRLGSYDPGTIRQGVVNGYGPEAFLRDLLPIYDRATRAA